MLSLNHCFRSPGRRNRENRTYRGTASYPAISHVLCGQVAFHVHADALALWDVVAGGIVWRSLSIIVVVSDLVT